MSSPHISSSSPSVSSLRNLYWTDWNRDSPKIETSYMDGTHRRVLVHDDLGLPNGLTFDAYSSQLCWVDAGEAWVGGRVPTVSRPVWTARGCHRKRARENVFFSCTKIAAFSCSESRGFSGRDAVWGGVSITEVWGQQTPACGVQPAPCPGVTRGLET